MCLEATTHGKLGLVHVQTAGGESSRRGNVTVKTSDWQLEAGGFASRSFHLQTTTLDNLLMHTTLLPTSSIHVLVLVVMPCGREDNRKSGVLLTLHHRLKEIRVNFTVILT